MKENNNGTGVTLSGLVFIAFLVLKLTSVINWSWWWITAPLWGPIVIYLFVIITILLVVFIGDTVRNIKRKRK